MQEIIERLQGQVEDKVTHMATIQTKFTELGGRYSFKVERFFSDS